MTKDEALKMAIDAMKDVFHNCSYWEATTTQKDFLGLIEKCEQVLRGTNDIYKSE